MVTRRSTVTDLIRESSRQTWVLLTLLISQSCCRVSTQHLGTVCNDVPGLGFTQVTGSSGVCSLIARWSLSSVFVSSIFVEVMWWGPNICMYDWCNIKTKVFMLSQKVNCRGSTSLPRNNPIVEWQKIYLQDSSFKWKRKKHLSVLQVAVAWWQTTGGWASTHGAQLDTHTLEEIKWVHHQVQCKVARKEQNFLPVSGSQWWGRGWFRWVRLHGCSSGDLRLWGGFFPFIHKQVGGHLCTSHQAEEVLLVFFCL